MMSTSRNGTLVLAYQMKRNIKISENWKVYKHKVLARELPDDYSSSTMVH